MSIYHWSLFNQVQYVLDHEWYSREILSWIDTKLFLEENQTTGVFLWKNSNVQLSKSLKA